MNFPLDYLTNMQKPKEYDWKDSNMEFVGSNADRAVKKESALTEPAWKGSGQRVGLEIWRINQFKVEKWPKEEYGKFYSGDSYIILNTYKDVESEELLYDLHFWIGKYSTQDEYGTAAYKTVELDTYHDDKPIQHREVQNHESHLFKGYFNVITLLKGGALSGFRNVRPTEYKKRLFQVVGEKKSINVKEIQMKKGNITSEDVFIVDLGLELFQFNGKNANKDEKFKATQYVQKLKAERMGKASLEVLEEDEVGPDHVIFGNLSEKIETKVKRRAPPPPTAKKGMHQLSDSTGRMKFMTVLEGKLDSKLLDSKDVYLVDAGTHLFVWVGKKASVDERKNAMAYAHNFLRDKCNPFCPVTCLGEKQAKKSKEFQAVFA